MQWVRITRLSIWVARWVARFTCFAPRTDGRVCSFCQERRHDTRDSPGVPAPAGDAGTDRVVHGREWRRNADWRCAQPGQGGGRGYCQRPHPGTQYWSHHGEHQLFFRGRSRIFARSADIALPDRSRKRAGHPAEFHPVHSCAALSRQPAHRQRYQQHHCDRDRRGGGGSRTHGFSGLHRLPESALRRFRPGADGSTAFVQLLSSESGNAGHDHLDVQSDRARLFRYPWDLPLRLRSRRAARSRSWSRSHRARRPYTPVR